MTLYKNILWFLTASTPNTEPCSDPYRKSRMPPAFVETFPPMWQLPFAPRSRGIISPCCSTCLSRFSRMQPAWQVKIPGRTRIEDTDTFLITSDEISTCNRIKGNNLIHSSCRQNYFIENWNTTANQSRVATLWTNSQSSIVAVLQHLSNFFGGFWQNDDTAFAWMNSQN